VSPTVAPVADGLEFCQRRSPMQIPPDDFPTFLNRFDSTRHERLPGFSARFVRQHKLYARDGNWRWPRRPTSVKTRLLKVRAQDVVVFVIHNANGTDRPRDLRD